MTAPRPRRGTPAAAAADAERRLDDYWSDAERPLSSLVFLLPLLIAYEVGMRHVAAAWGTAPGAAGAPHIYAFTMLRRFFALFGATGQYLPPLAVVAILLAWHVARRDVWGVRVGTLLWMGIESCILALPVLGIGYATSQYFALAHATVPLGDYVILSIGAGVYEELVFRLMLMTVLTVVLRDAFHLSWGWTGLLMVVCSGILFSAYHYLSPVEEFRVRTFVFRALAGIYFGVVFLCRGFGITAASHAVYDVIIVVLTIRR